MHQRLCRSDAPTRSDDQAALHQVQKVGVILPHHLLQRPLLAHALALLAVQLLAQEVTLLVEQLPPPRRQRANHALWHLAHDLLDQREVQRVAVLCVTSSPHAHGLEEQVAGEQLHGDARHAPDVRLLVPLHAQQHLRRAVLARVDRALAPLVAVRRAAVVDHYASTQTDRVTRHVRTTRQPNRLVEVVLHAYASARARSPTRLALHGGEQQVLQLQVRVCEPEAVQELQRLQQLLLIHPHHAHVLQDGPDVRHGEGRVVALLQHVVEAAAQQVHHHAVVPVELELVEPAVDSAWKQYRW